MDNYPIGIIVDSVEEVVKIPDSSVQNLPESTSTAESKEYITGIGMLDKRLIILLDLDKVLTGTALFNVDELNKAIKNTKTVETPKPTAAQSDAVPPSPRATDEVQAVKKPEKMKTDIPDTKPPVDTGKSQPKRRAG
jgi:hypothetical protein